MEDVAIDQGLSSEEASRRRDQYGDNVIQEYHSSLSKKFLSFFWGPIPGMIEVALLLSAALKRIEELIIIALLLLLNAGVGFWQEYKADNAIAALKQKLALQARVLRDGKWQDMPAAMLVPGDIILVKLGSIIPADIKLLKGNFLSVDESALTGESFPVEKQVGDLAYSGAIVKLGEMIGVVTATGMNTFFGKTAKLVETAKTVSHYKKAVLKIGNFLIAITLVLVIIILTVTLLRHAPLVDTIIFSLILTIAAIPVALPAVLSVTMAVGALRLAKMQAIISKLESIEEMAGMDVLCSDKTGTLTKNQLTCAAPMLVQAQQTEEVELAAALATEIHSNESIDQAILQNLPKNIDLKNYEMIDFKPFDPVSKRTEAKIKENATIYLVSKGAPQVILNLLENEDQQAFAGQINSQVNELAAKGYRAIGVAKTDENQRWHYLGLIPLFDPPREDSAATIQAAKNMGLKIKMVTGDHVAIAKEMASKLGLSAKIIAANQIFSQDKKQKIDGHYIETVDGFAEVFPQHKFQIVRCLQTIDHIVGMTGDGVNDAPALKEADVGIAVSGATDAARAAADLVLTNPGLSVIVRAVEEARKIFERMNSYAIYRIAETIRILLFISASILWLNFYPITAVMIILLAILNDFPIMMIAYDNAPIAMQPVRWQMHRVLSISFVLGCVGVVETFLLFFIVKHVFGLPLHLIQTILFLKLLVAGHLTLYVARNTGTLWQRPLPNWRLLVTTETTQIIGTLAAVYGWFMTPIGWYYALLIWVYALLWLFVESGVKIVVYKYLIKR